MALTLFRPRRHADGRGWFHETHSDRRFDAAGLNVRFVQDNQAWSRAAGTVRGLHFQNPPRAQAKLVSCIVGRILDYVVDIRRASPTFGRAMAVELTGAGEQLFVPEGFAHGYVTLTPDALMAYKVSCPYAPEAEGGIAWNDPDLDLAWPLDGMAPILSDRDADLPPLARLDSAFAYDGVPMSLREV